MKTIIRWLRRAWNWLTSMRTALVLLFLLALAAIPGALLPQRSLNESNVADYLAANGTVAQVYDKLHLFDVFSAPWFTAIYVLLTISLVGCIIPRTLEHWRAMRTPPVRAPKVLSRMPHHAQGRVEEEVGDVEKRVRGYLRGWHVARYTPEEDRAGALSLSAERGYARELCNLIFHLSLVAILVTVAAGRLVSYEGHVIVVTGTGSNPEIAAAQKGEFCNTSPANFDTFRGGLLFDGTGLNPFCFIPHDFTADYLPNGQAEMFSSTISYARGDDITTDPSSWKTYDLKVNHPLRLGGDRIYLQGHGFAPTFTVTWPNGETRSQTLQWLPDDPTFFLSSGAMRFDPPAGMYPDLYERRQHQLAIQGLFAPTAAWSGEKGELLSSAFPQMRDPAVAIDVYRGDNGLDTGVGQNIFTLDRSLIHSGQLRKIDRVNLSQGQQVTLDDGTKIRFDGASEYANYVVGHDPTQGFVLAAAISMLVSLMASLMIKRRRVWVRLRPGAQGGTDIELGGLARTDHAGWGGEFDALARKVLLLPDPDEEEEEEEEADDRGAANSADASGDDESDASPAPAGA